MRNIWLGDKKQFLQSMDGTAKVSQVGERFKVNVYVRFRPKRNEEESSGFLSPYCQYVFVLYLFIFPFVPSASNRTGSTRAVTLPLHQRLSMIRMSQRLPSNAAALKVLAAEGQWFEARWNALLDPVAAAAAVPAAAQEQSEDGDKENASSQK